VYLHTNYLHIKIELFSSHDLNKKKLSSLCVNVSEVIRESLQEEVDRLEKEKLNELAKEVSVVLKKIPPEEFAKSIRASYKGLIPVPRSFI